MNERKDGITISELAKLMQVSVHPSIAGFEWKMGLRFLFAPRSITTEEYMNEIEAF